MTKTVEISLEAARAMVPVVERDLDTARGELEFASQKVDQLEHLLAELKAKTTNSLLPLQNGEALRKRKPKGFAANTIGDLLKNFSFGLTMQDIEVKTGIDRTTIYRTLKNPARNKGRFIEGANGLWMVPDDDMEKK